MKLSVIVPAYNEEKNFRSGNLRKMLAYLKSQNYSFEVILVDDGSTDGTLNLLETFAKDEPSVSVLANPHQGKSLTVKTGMKHAKGSWRLYTDFDQSTPISELEKFWPFAEKGYQVLVGSREIKGSIRAKEPWYRHLMGRVFNWTVRLFSVRGIMDTQCGFKMFSKKAASLFDDLVVTIKPSRVAFTGAFDVELLYLAQQRGYEIAEIPVHWNHHETERVSPIKDSVKMFVQILKIWWLDVLGGYDD